MKGSSAVIGYTEALAVEDPQYVKMFKRLKPGDVVEVAYAEAVAVSVRAAGTRKSVPSGDRFIGLAAATPPVWRRCFVCGRNVPHDRRAYSYRMPSDEAVSMFRYPSIGRLLAFS